MPIDSMKVGPMKAHNNNNITEQLMQINNNREEIQMGHCLKLPYGAILITPITWKVWNSTHKVQWMLFVNFVRLLDLSLKRGMDKYLLENYAAMEIRLIQETY